MYYLQSRYYDPVVSRFVNGDEVALNTFLSKGSEIAINLFPYCKNNPVASADYTGYWVVSVGLEAGAAFIIGLYLAFGVNFDGTYLSLTLALGMLIATNAAASISGYFAYYPSKKSVENLRGWGASSGASISVGFHGGASMGGEFQQNGHGFSASLGYGVSLAPIPYFQVKFGYTWQLAKWNLSKTKNNKSKTLSIRWVPNSKVKIVKKPNYAEVYIFSIKKKIRIFTKTRKIKVL